MHFKETKLFYYLHRNELSKVSRIGKAYCCFQQHATFQFGNTELAKWSGARAKLHQPCQPVQQFPKESQMRYVLLLHFPVRSVIE